MTDFKAIQNAPVRRLAHADLKLQLSRLIRDRNGLVGCHIRGRQQSGKSSYALLAMYELYQGNVDAVLKHTVFSIKGLTELLNNAVKNDERMICVLWDDASVQGSAGQYNINRELVQYVSAMGDTMGLATKGIILTSPSGDIIKAFRNYDFYKAEVHQGRGKYDRFVKGYTYGMSPKGQRWCRLEFKDNYDTRVPFYDRYYKLRKQLSVSTLADMNTFLNKQEPQPKETKGEKAVRLHRDYKAGVFGDLTFKEVCIANGLSPQSAKSMVSQLYE